MKTEENEAVNSIEEEEIHKEETGSEEDPNSETHIDENLVNMISSLKNSTILELHHKSLNIHNDIEFGAHFLNQRINSVFRLLNLKIKTLNRLNSQDSKNQDSKVFLSLFIKFRNSKKNVSLERNLSNRNLRIWIKSEIS